MQSKWPQSEHNNNILDSWSGTEAVQAYTFFQFSLFLAQILCTHAELHIREDLFRFIFNMPACYNTQMQNWEILHTKALQ